MKIIVVNNPAARNSGALTILTEFLEKISALKCNRKFVIFVSLEELKKYETEKIKIQVISSQGFISRIIWDGYGLKRYLKKIKIVPDIFISLQNTGVNLPKNIPQIVYYHQLISLSKNRWNPLLKEERIYWKYKNIYPFFIKQYIRKIKVFIVQAEWIKREFSKSLKIPLDIIFIEKPIVRLFDIEKIKVIPKEKIRLFYPAKPLIYKNHEILIKALGELRNENINLDKEIECIFTFSKSESKRLDKLINQYKLNNIIKLIGEIPFENVLEYYKSSDLLVFPSYIETLGLPLLEAQKFNLQILASNLPYAKNTIDNYNKVEYLDYKSITQWKLSIINYCKQK